MESKRVRPEVRRALGPKADFLTTTDWTLLLIFGMDHSPTEVVIMARDLAIESEVRTIEGENRAALSEGEDMPDPELF